MVPGLRFVELGLELALEVWRAMTTEQKQEVIRRCLEDTGAIRKGGAEFFDFVRKQFEALKP